MHNDECVDGSTDKWCALTDARQWGIPIACSPIACSLFKYTIPLFNYTYLLPCASRMLIYGGCLGTSAFSDIYLLQKDLSSGQYSWRRIQATTAAPPPSFGTLAPPSAPAEGPGDRCAHTAVPHARGMIVFGGRVPLSLSNRNSESTWQTLSDSWFFDLDAALSGGKLWWPITNSETGDVLLNRSDHTLISVDDSLMIFGGLYTDVAEGTIYIMKDFLRLTLPQALSAATYPSRPASASEGWLASSERLEWGPTWRFDHSMVVAPFISDPLDRGSPNLQNAPLLYGGGGGMDIYDDIWAYDASRRAWHQVEVLSSISKTQSIITSLMFGTVGFTLYTCIIFCVFMRKVARSRRQLGQLADVETGAAAGGPRPLRRGISSETIDALPRISWSAAKASAEDAVGQTSAAGKKAAPSVLNEGIELSDMGAGEAGGEKLMVEDVSSNASDEKPLAGEGAGSSSEEVEKQTADLEEGDDLCSVCLCDYDDADVLIR